MTTLELGCGSDPHPDADVTLDISPLETVDIVWDLEETPWPIDTDSVDRVIAIHLVEHISDLESFFDEVARVLTTGGQANIHVPVGRQMFTDPTHEQFFTYNTPEFLFDGDHEREYYYDFPLTLEDRELIARVDAPIIGALSPVLNWVSHRWPGDWLSGTPWFSGELRFTVRRS